MFIQVLNEWINQFLEEMIEPAIFDVSYPSSHLVLRGLAASNAPA